MFKSAMIASMYILNSVKVVKKCEIAKRLDIYFLKFEKISVIS